MPLRHFCSFLTVAALLSAGCNNAATSGIPAQGARSARGVARTWTARAVSGLYALTDYPIPTPNSYPNRIVTGPDGALWFAEGGYAASKIGRVDTQGHFREFQLAAGSEPSHVASAYGNIWFTSDNADTVGYITPGGQITTYATQSSTRGIVRGAGKSRVWFTEFQAGSVAIADGSSGVITQYPIPTQSSEPYDVAFDKSNGLLWFTEYEAQKIGRVTGTGAFKEYKTPDKPDGLALGPDGALWFTEPTAGKIGRMTTKGDVTEHPTPTAGSEPGVITPGPDGALWFTEFKASKIGRITVDGTITETDTPDANAQPTGITTGPDNNIWFVEHATNAIVKLEL